MGGNLGIIRDQGRRIGPPNLNEQNYIMLKKLWSEIETHPQKYGREIYMRLLAQFPKYIKYFIEENSAPYEDAQRINDKFALILASLGYLIIDFYYQPKKFDRLLDYVALIHQDMHLKAEDFYNFTHVLIQHLKVTMPEMMTEECANTFTVFMEDLTDQLVAKMAKDRRDVFDEIENKNRIHHPCRWLYKRDKVIYGHARSYWIARRNRWKVKIQKWENSVSGIMESTTLYNFLNGLNNENDKQQAGSSQPLKLRTIEPRARGSVMSQILHEKIWNDEKEAVFKTGTLRSQSSQMLKNSGRKSSRDRDTLIIESRMSPRERFRNRRPLENSQNDASTSNNQEVDLDQRRDKKVETDVPALQRDR